MDELLLTNLYQMKLSVLLVPKVNVHQACLTSVRKHLGRELKKNKDAELLQLRYSVELVDGRIAAASVSFVVV